MLFLSIIISKYFEGKSKKQIVGHIKRDRFESGKNKDFDLLGLLLTVISHRINEALVNKHTTRRIEFDIMKAFEKQWPRMLLQSLSSV